MASAILSSPQSLLCYPGREVIASRAASQNSFPRRLLKTKRFSIRESSRNSRHYAVIASVLGKNAKKRETVVPEPDYRIPVVLLGIAGGFAYQDNLLPAATIGLLGFLLLFQTTRVRFVFDEEALSPTRNGLLHEVPNRS